MITNDLTFHQKRRLIKAFFKSQFKYLFLTWMFHSQTSNKKINLLHERTLRMIFMMKLSYLKNLKKFTSLLFIILIFSQWPLIYSKLATIYLQPLLITYFQDFIIITNFPQNLVFCSSFGYCQNSLPYYGPLTWNATTDWIRDCEA